MGEMFSPAPPCVKETKQGKTLQHILPFNPYHRTHCCILSILLRPMIEDSAPVVTPSSDFFVCIH